MRYAGVMVGLLGAGSLSVLHIPWSEFLGRGAAEQLLAFLSDLAHPNLSWAAIGHWSVLMLETVAMAWVATVVAALIAFFVAPLGSRRLCVGSFLRDPEPSRGWLKGTNWLLLVVARLVMQTTRAFPELVWALVFIVWVGPGSFAGMLAVMVHTVGILGRLFLDVYDDVDTEPARSLQSDGASRVGLWAYGVLPPAAPRLMAFTLFRFEVNVRMTTMVGFVGAGGLGDALHTAMSLFHMADLAGLLVVLVVGVAVVDALGGRFRQRFLQSAG